MKNFVRDRSAADNPQNGPNLTRAQKAAQAKIHVGGATLKNKQTEQQNSSARRQSGSTANPQAAPLQNLPQRGSRPGQTHPDRYDTDAESLDTTNHGHSMIKFEDDREADHQKHVEVKDDDDNDDDGDYDASSEARGHQDSPGYGFSVLVQHLDLQGKSREAQEAYLKQKGFKWWDDGEEARSEGNGLSSPPSSIQVPIAGLPARQHGQHNTTRGTQAVQPGNTMLNRTNYFQEGAAIRKEKRATANLAVRGGASYQADTGLLPANQPPTYSQVSREPIAPVNAVPQYSQPNQNRVLEHPGFEPNTRDHTLQPFPQVFPPRQRPAETSAHIARSAQAMPKMEPVIHHEPVIADTNVREPVEDYDTPALFEKSYDELKAEDFDTVPRGQPKVLSEDMANKPLADRLSHVHKKLNIGDQDKFFRALPSREWEEAGDWFLDQFSNIITGIKEARQKKRKLAIDFEDRVEKRYRQVAKRQQNVKDALNKMKQQGESLVPKSPRSSKSPKKM